jgi:co-chaperonin GroES (HSP10)
MSREATNIFVLTPGEAYVVPPGRFLVRPLEEKTVAGLTVVNDKQNGVGLLLQRGEKLSEQKTTYPIGCTLYYVRTNSMEVVLEGEKYLIIHWRDVMLGKTTTTDGQGEGC